MPWRAADGRWWWDRPALPYLVLSVSPVLTLLFGRLILFALPDCGLDEPWWELRDFELALLPALLDFLPFLWLASRAPGVRRAAFVAGLIGTGRYAIVQAATLIQSTSFDGQFSNADCTISVFFLVVLVPIMLILWLVSALIAGVILLRARRTPAGRPD